MAGNGTGEPKLDKQNGPPIYVQLKNIMKSKIESGELGSRRIPPIRRLAKEYGVSVNTVLRAYEGLGQEGIISGTVGRGTFITTAPQELRRENRRALLEKAIEHALEEALSLEFTMEEFVKAAGRFVDKKQRMMERVHLVFIECNSEQLLYFTDHLELDPHIHRYPLLLEDLLRQEAQTMELIGESDIIVTSFYHLDEVQELLGQPEKPIVGISLVPEMSTIIRIAKIPNHRTVGIVTTSEQFRKIIREVMEELELVFDMFLETSSQERQIVQQLVDRCDVVLVSPKRRQLVEELSPPGCQAIEFVFTPDRTSINNLKVALLELNDGGRIKERN